MKRTAQLLGLITLLALSWGCERHPVNRLLNPAGFTSTATWGSPFVVFDDELRTGGDIMFFTTDEGQSLTLASADAPASGTKCARYSWDGGDTRTYSGNLLQHDYVGFSFIAADKTARYDSAFKDLTPGNYTKITFKARGELNNNVYLRLEFGNVLYTVSTGPNVWMSNAGDKKIMNYWRQFEFPIAGSMTTVKDYVKVVLRYDEDGDPTTTNTARGNGGTIYLDDIRFE